MCWSHFCHRKINSMLTNKIKWSNITRTFYFVFFTFGNDEIAIFLFYFILYLFIYFYYYYYYLFFYVWQRQATIYKVIVSVFHKSYFCENVGYMSVITMSMYFQLLFVPYLSVCVCFESFACGVDGDCVSICIFKSRVIKYIFFIYIFNLF